MTNAATKHTPGPWGCVDTSNHSHDYRLTRPNGDSLPVNAPHNDHSEQRANARLIAAAPDMLAALEARLVLCKSDRPCDRWHVRIGDTVLSRHDSRGEAWKYRDRIRRAAIAKATA